MKFRISHILYPLFIGIVGFVTFENSGAVQINVKLPDGFEIKQVANDELASNIFCLSSNPRGDIFVSGPGYIRCLIDRDQDGVFESATQFASFPKSGAQGLYCEEQFILAVGDEGVWRLDDADQDGIADGPPQRLLEIGTGGEHLAHAIRRGPDGWFYLIAGNATPIKPDFFAGQFSPVKHPRAGFLMRFSPDVKTHEVVAHGFRNAYDFAFNSSGQIFVYDSDGERDISLPWYRPTRVFQIQAGDDAGYVAEGWKRPSYFFDMPTQIGALGRGSPTGVECYQEHRFPAEYDDCIFVADWTFGRIVACKRDPISGIYDEGSPFAISAGQFGFAVTDLAIARDGSLLVSVGGRGTAGSIYRITYGSHQLSPNQLDRIPGMNERTLRQNLLFSNRDAWSDEKTDEVLSLLVDPDDDKRVVALESLVGRTRQCVSGNEKRIRMLIAGLEKNLETFERTRAKLVYRISDELDSEVIQQIDTAKIPVKPTTLFLLAFANESKGTSALMTRLVADLTDDQVDHAQLARIGQLMMGGCSATSRPEMFQGYTAATSFELTEEQRDLMLNYFSFAIPMATLGEDQAVTRELGRWAAMLKLEDTALQVSFAEQIDGTSDPIGDIHWLNCLARTGKIGDRGLRQAMAAALTHVDRKIASEKLPTDRNWVPRMRELTQALFQQTPELATTVVEWMDGREGQSFIFDALPAEFKPDAIAKFARAIEQDWSQVSDAQLRIVASSNQPNYQPMLRRAALVPGLKETAIAALSKTPDQKDRSLYRSGLESWDSETVRRSAQALQMLSNDHDPEELLLAFKAAQRLGWERPDIAARDELMLLLQANTGQTMGYEFKRPKREQREPLEKWRSFLQESYPNQIERLTSSDVLINVEDLIKEVDPAAGDAVRGEQLYRDLKCAQCHEGNSALGPRLEGVTKRFDRADLYRAIVDPSREISERYRATIVETADGLIYKGTVIYESVDGLTLQDINGQTIRINSVDIQSKTLSQTSLMPAHLMDEVPLRQWADLESFLRTK